MFYATLSSSLFWSPHSRSGNVGRMTLSFLGIATGWGDHGACLCSACQSFSGWPIGSQRWEGLTNSCSQPSAVTRVSHEARACWGATSQSQASLLRSRLPPHASHRLSGISAGTRQFRKFTQLINVGQRSAPSGIAFCFPTHPPSFSV